MTNEEYHDAPGISSSDFRLLELSPLHLEHKELFALEGDALKLGTLVHALVLEPESFEERFAVETFEGCDLNKNSKAYKEARAAWLESVGDRTVVPLDLWQKAEAMATRVLAIAGNLLSDGIAEESFFVDDSEFGVRRKCRPDYLRDDGVLIDLKTTRDGSPHEFAKSIAAFGYARQMAYYADTLRMAGREVSACIIVTVDTTAPFMVRVYRLDDESLESGRQNYRRLLEEWKRYQETGRAKVIWPIGLPAWALEGGAA
ncbi:PD-(D/E)XK nuclease-like domain-containing protein [Nitratifractor sp.]